MILLIKALSASYQIEKEENDEYWYDNLLQYVKLSLLVPLYDFVKLLFMKNKEFVCHHIYTYMTFVWTYNVMNVL